MNILVIEAATTKGAVAVVKSDGLQVVANRELPVGLQNSAMLMPAIAAVVKEAELTAHQLDLIVAGVGPGSYTGLRVAAAVSKAMSWAARIPLVGVPTLHGFVPSENVSNFAAIIDAKISGAYLAIGEKRHGSCLFEGEPQVVPLQQLSTVLRGIEVVICPQIEPLKNKINTVWPQMHLKWIESYPDVSVLADQGLVRHTRGEFTLDGSLDLLYLRKTQAEIEAGRR